MKKIIKIAKIELANFFYSPIAWIVLIIFVVQTGLVFSDVLTRLQAEYAIGMRHPGLTYDLFTSKYSGLFVNIQPKLFLYIPLLTMGLMSREINSGSIKLLLSSPVKIRDIVLGKFLSMMVLGLLLIGVLGVYMITGFIAIETLDWLNIISAMIGFFLLICAYAAIGLFMSSITSYQVVAAISTLIILTGLNYIGYIWQDHDFFRDITYNLSLPGRMVNFIDGLLTSREVIYFVGIIVFFLLLTMMRLLYQRRSSPFRVRIIGYSLLSVGLVVLGFISSIPYLVGYVDMTYNNKNTISPESQEILQSFNEPLEITTYVNLFSPEDYHEFKPADRYADLRRLELYQRFRPDMKIKYVYYYDTLEVPRIMADYPRETIHQIAMRYIEANDQNPHRYLKPDEIHKQINLKGEGGMIVRQLKIGDKAEIVRATFADLPKYANEKEYMAAIRKMTTKPEEIRFVAGHNEKDIFRVGNREYGVTYTVTRHREAVINQGFKIDTLSLANDSIPEGLAALVIADPKLDFSQDELDKLQRYINRGGNLMILGELRKQDVINKLTGPLGFEFYNASMFQKTPAMDRFQKPDVVIVASRRDFETDTTMKMQPNTISGYMFKSVAGFKQIRQPDFEVINTAVSDTLFTWLRPGVQDISDSATVSYSPQIGDERKEVPAVIKLVRKINNKNQKILLIGDADLFTNARAGQMTSLFNLNIYSWFCEGKYPIQTSFVPPIDDKITISKNGAFCIKWAFLAVIPALLVLAGTAVLIRRKRK